MVSEKAKAACHQTSPLAPKTRNRLSSEKEQTSFQERAVFFRKKSALFFGLLYNPYICIKYNKQGNDKWKITAITTNTSKTCN